MVTDGFLRGGSEAVGRRPNWEIVCTRSVQGIPLVVDVTSNKTKFSSIPLAQLQLFIETFRDGI